jgi:excisionase family DNA binding protein
MNNDNNHELERLREENETMNISQAAKILGIGRDTLYRRIERGYIAKTMKNGQPRISIEELKRYLKN